ncbi:MAG TPA: methyltransferase domain-containing protein [Myxococcaceae bacterium]|jgi:2-polyprenyl-3-methyl-5-hydroxy-6-metoxy-1,4-benzoquinol methylase
MTPDQEARSPSPSAVATYYDDWTSRYLEHFGDTIQAHRPTRLEDLHAYLAKQAGIRDGKRVLDAGCGVCGPSVSFARGHAITVEALTISPVQARMASEHVAKAGLSDRIHVRAGDFHRLEQLYPREEFDLVYFLESMSHSPRPDRVLAGVAHVLKPGGIVYIKDYFIRQCETAEEQRRVMRVIENVDRLFETKTPVVAEMIAHLRAAGFLPVRIQRPAFQVDNRPWQAFERAGGFDLFDGQPSFDWSEWWELKFQKP